MLAEKFLTDVNQKIILIDDDLKTSSVTLDKINQNIAHTKVGQKVSMVVISPKNLTDVG